MAEYEVERRLAAILSADVEGYSRLMDADEVATVRTLGAHRAAATALIDRHHGRVVSTPGDAVLAEFASVVEAVQCAVAVQREIGARNDTLARDRRMHFRIGINVGDVIVEGDDIYGEGVNIAARLQGIAEPGGVCVSGAVFEQVKNKLAISYEFLGEQHVKNIADPVPTYRLQTGARARSTAWPPPRPKEPPTDPPAAASDSDRYRLPALALCLLFGVLGAHRFYLGRAGTGLLHFFSGGGLVVWWLIDCVHLAAGDFTDGRGRRLTRWI